MKNNRLLLLGFCLVTYVTSNAQEVEILQTFGSSAEIHMTPKSTGGNNIFSMLNTGDFDRSIWRLIFDKNELVPPQGPIEFAWEVGLGGNPGVNRDFFSIGRYDFNIDFVFWQTGLVMDNVTLFTGIGELTPDARLHVYNNDNFGSSRIPATIIGQHQGNVAYGYLTVDQPNTDDNDNIARFRDNGATQVWINRDASTYQLTVFGDALASGGIWVNSDKKLKENIEELKLGLEGLRKLRPSTYKFDREPEWNKHLPEEQQFGLVAQELREVYPNLVRESDQFDEEGNLIGKLQSVNYIGLIPVLMASVKELDQELTSKTTAFDQLQRENTELRERLMRLETIVDQLSKN